MASYGWLRVMAQCSPDSPACFFVSESLLVLTTFLRSGIASLQCPPAAKESARSLLTGTLELAFVFWAAEVTHAARSSPATIQIGREIAEIISRVNRKSSTKLWVKTSNGRRGYACHSRFTSACDQK